MLKFMLSKKKEQFIFYAAIVIICSDTHFFIKLADNQIVCSDTYFIILADNQIVCSNTHIIILPDNQIVCSDTHFIILADNHILWVEQLCGVFFTNIISRVERLLQSQTQFYGQEPCLLHLPILATSGSSTPIFIPLCLVFMWLRTAAHITPFL